jgi:hypothetical protein
MDRMAAAVDTALGQAKRYSCLPALHEPAKTQALHGTCQFAAGGWCCGGQGSASTASSTP